MTVRPVLTVINPNTDIAVTRFMVDIVSETLGSEFAIAGRTASSGPPIITNEEALAHAADEVIREGETAAAAGSVSIVVAAFGDPGVATLARRVKIPVTGIAEAAIAEAANDGRRFSIVTTTPLLEQPIANLAVHYGYGDQLAAVRITPGAAEVTMATPQGLAEALLTLCRLSIVEDGAEAIVIGGGPLALAARAIANQISVPLIEPVSAAARLAAARYRERLRNAP